MSENNIPKSAFADLFGALAVSGFLLLTAWGNAIAMFVVSLLGVAIGIALLPRKLRRDATMIAALAGVVGCAASLVLIVPCSLNGLRIYQCVSVIGKDRITADETTRPTGDVEIAKER